jgi:hypothetical protein
VPYPEYGPLVNPAIHLPGGTARQHRKIPHAQPGIGKYQVTTAFLNSLMFSCCSSSRSWPLMVWGYGIQDLLSAGDGAMCRHLPEETQVFHIHTGSRLVKQRFRYSWHYWAKRPQRIGVLVTVMISLLTSMASGDTGRTTLCYRGNKAVRLGGQYRRLCFT